MMSWPCHAEEPAYDRGHDRPRNGLFAVQKCPYRQLLADDAWAVLEHLASRLVHIQVIKAE